MNEFSLIEQFFKPLSIQSKEVLLGIGDDAACLQIPADNHLLVSTDTLVSEVHFLPTWNPYDLAYRSLMVNISDMAAMAAQPRWITLALTLPAIDKAWLASFTQGLQAALHEWNIVLIGGDTTRGPLSITITIMGLVPQGQAILRQGAKPGDTLLVSGPLGAAALAVRFLKEPPQDPLSEEDQAELMKHLLHPKPRVDMIQALRSHASCAIDISDGLSADLNHLCVASGVGACLTRDAIPIHPLVKKYLGPKAIDFALTGGDDYELCFAVSTPLLESFLALCKSANLVCYPIGVIEAEQGLRTKTAEKGCVDLTPSGYTHF